jgi:hypothetical protein
MPFRASCVRGLLVCLISALMQCNLSAQDNQTGQSDAAKQQIKANIQATTDNVTNSVEQYCKYNPNETNPKTIQKTNACINNAIRIHQERIRLNNSLRSTAQAEAITQERNKLAGSIPTNILPVQPAPAVAAGALGAGSGPVQAFVGGSAIGTPTTCGQGSGINNAALIRVHRQVMTPKTASDDFGYRLGQRYVVYQVTVENGSKDFQFMLQDVSVDFSPYFNAPAGTYSYSASGQDLSLLRGVPEKGQDLDPRNAILHVLQGIGSVAGAVSGLTSFADVMGPSVAVFNGAFLQAYTTIAPDHTSTQLNRLSDSAFTANTVIDKQRAKTIAMFIPVDEILSKEEKKGFRKDPYTYLALGDDAGIFNGADVCVDGSFVQAVNVAAPVLNTAILPAPAPAANSDAVLAITGSNLVAGDTIVVISGATPASFPVVTTDGKNGTAQVHLPSDYVSGTTTATLQSKSNPSLTSGKGVIITIAH